MNTSSQVDRPSALVKLFISRLSTTLSIAGLVAAATVAGLASGAEVILIASAPTAVAQYASAEQRMATIEFFDNYDATARRELQKVARYPNKSEARNQRLEGKVGVAFEVNNRGDLQNAEVIQSSQSKILDSAAMASVRWAKYPAFAADMQAGEESRRYTVIFDYRFPVEK
jgi:TonB family protein